MTNVPPGGAQLASTGVQIDIGPFLVRVRADLPGVAVHLSLLYDHFPMTDVADGHFDVAVVGTPGLRRWLRPQATLVVNGRRPFLPLPADLAGPLLEWGINWSIGNRAHRWVIVHAAVVERDGAALILCAPSGSGKSTLCAALAYGGWRLLSDEFALIDPDGSKVFPSPRPVSLKDAAIAIIRARHPDVPFSPERIDVEGARFVHARPPAESVRRAAEPAVPTWVVFPRYTPGHPTELRPLPRARALARLADQSFNYNYLGVQGFSCLAHVARTAQVYEFEYSNLDEALACFSALPTS